MSIFKKWLRLPALVDRLDDKMVDLEGQILHDMGLVGIHTDQIKRLRADMWSLHQLHGEMWKKWQELEKQ